MTIQSVVPVEEIEMDNHPSILLAQDECDELGGNNNVMVMTDEILNQPCVEITGPESLVTFPTQSALPQLVLMLRHLEKFMSFQIEIQDTTKTYRILQFSNKVSIARVSATRAILPLDLVTSSEWQYLPIQLDELTSLCFGVTYAATVQIQIKATCRILKIFFQDQPYADIQLPEHLKVMH